MPRTAGRQNNRDNYPASDASEYFKRIITILILDHLNSDFKNRFEFNSVNAYNGLSIVPSKIIASLNACKSGDQSWKQ